MFIYEGFVLKSLVKQQFKMHLPPPGGNPILASMYDLYKNPREDRLQDSIQVGVGFGANFSLMAQRNLAMKESTLIRLRGMANSTAVSRICVQRPRRSSTASCSLRV